MNPKKIQLKKQVLESYRTAALYVKVKSYRCQIVRLRKNGDAKTCYLVVAHTEGLLERSPVLV